PNDRKEQLSRGLLATEQTFCSRTFSTPTCVITNDLDLIVPVHYPISIPPLTFSTCPVIYEASSDARKLTALATSSVLPTLPSGIIFTAVCLNSSLSTAVIPVSTKPGATALHVMFREATSRAIAIVSPISPAFDAA